MRRSLSVVDNVWTAFTDITRDSTSSSLKQEAAAQQQIPDPHSLSSGEIIFVTILVSIITIAVGLAIQSICQRRKEKQREKENAAVDQKIAVTTVEMGTDEDYTNNGPVIGGSSRRFSIDSTSSGRNSMAGFNRKDSTTSLASRVSLDYKFAAIEHMNQIAQRGRHDG